MERDVFGMVEWKSLKGYKSENETRTFLTFLEVLFDFSLYSLGYLELQFWPPKEVELAIRIFYVTGKWCFW